MLPAILLLAAIIVTLLLIIRFAGKRAGDLEDPLMKDGESSHQRDPFFQERAQEYMHGGGSPF